MLFFVFYNQQTQNGTIIFSLPDYEGKIALFSLNEENKKKYLKIDSASVKLKIFNSNGQSFEKLISNFLKKYDYKSLLPSRKKNANYQVQLGFLSPKGEHKIPQNKGFDVCTDIAHLMNKYIGKSNILHLFAYHGAHDSMYPEYFPSEELGGMKGMQKAICNIHEENQLCSLYMNARLFSVELLNKYPQLSNSIIRNSDGEKIVESYNCRDFYVMNPLSEKWRDMLVTRANFLKSLGADIIQLDQVAGRTAIGEIGYKWGFGYRALIQDIEKLNLEVWIQGINEIYPANRFELCYRHPNILFDGTVRGGHPFGKSYPLIPKLLYNQNFIVPLGSSDLLESIDNKNVTIDLEQLPGELSLYSSRYIENLISILKKLQQK